MDRNKFSTILHFVNTFYKCAQVGSPNVVISPGRPETNCALDILKLWNPNIFMNVEKIVVGPSPQYGHVESGPEKDPHIIYLNADRIIQESGGAQSGKAAALGCAKVIAHEHGHIGSFNEQNGFVGGEGPAEAEEQQFETWLESGGMQKVENLPSYKALN